MYELKVYDINKDDSYHHVYYACACAGDKIDNCACVRARTPVHHEI